MKQIIKYSNNFLPYFVYDSKLFFNRRLDFLRYKNNLFISINGSSNFSYLIYSKVFFFLRSRLLAEMYISRLFPFGSENIYFLGFKISSYIMKPISYGKSKFIYSVLSRLNFMKKKFANLFLKRIVSEFYIIFAYNSYTNSNFLYNSDCKRLWFNIFQFEILRIFHGFHIYGELKNKIPFPYIKVSKFLYFNGSLKYSFDVYIGKSRELFSLIIRQYPILIERSLFSTDSKFYMYFLEIKKKLFLSYIIRLIPSGEFGLFSSSVENNFNNSSILSLNYRSLKVDLLIPLSYIYLKLKFLGFFHSVRFRPIGNSKFLFLSDYSIIKEFSRFSYIFLFWYHFASNFTKLKLLIEYLRESCLLTLCRKHNKSKAWVNRVYSSSLFLFRGLFTFQSFFPSNLALLSLRQKFFLQGNFLFFPENFFLEP